MAVIHPVAEDFSAVAKAALAAAEDLGLPVTVVAATSSADHGMGLVVPDEVAAKFGDFMESSLQPIRVERDTEPEVAEETEAPAKRGPGRPRKVTTETEKTDG